MSDEAEVAALHDTVLDRDRQISELHDELLEQGRLNATIPAMRTHIAELTDRVVELTEAAEAREAAHREETKHLAMRVRSGMMTDEYTDDGEPI